MNKKNILEELFKDYKGENPHEEVDWGDDVGRERIWSMSDEEYENEYGENLVKYKVMFYFGVYHASPFLNPSKVVEVEADKTLGENEIIAYALMKLDVAYPRTYSARVEKI